MTSSTSSSKSYWGGAKLWRLLSTRPRDWKSPLLVFVLAFAALTVLGRLAAQDPRLARAVSIVPDDTAGNPEWYLAANGPHIDHQRLVYDIGGVLARARKADVLITGNSRAQFGFRQRELKAFAERTGMSLYHIGMGHGETDVLASKIIADHGLRPKLVIVNADRYFTGVPSPFGKRVLDMGHWGGLKDVFEQEVSFRVERTLRAVFPYFPRLNGQRRDYFISRSRYDGCWYPRGFPDWHEPVPKEADGGLAPTEQELARARAFQTLIQERGGKLVLTLVPGRGSSRASAEKLAHALNVPFIAPEPDGLFTLDGSHLEADSAQRFASLFFAQLEKHPVVGPSPLRTVTNAQPKDSHADSH